MDNVYKIYTVGNNSVTKEAGLNIPPSNDAAEAGPSASNQWDSPETSSWREKLETWMESLVRSEHRLIAVPHACVCVWRLHLHAWQTYCPLRGQLPTWQPHWLLRLEQGKYHHIWQELEIRQTHNSTQFQSGIYLSSLLFAIMPDTAGHLELCPKLAMHPGFRAEQSDSG